MIRIVTARGRRCIDMDAHDLAISAGHFDGLYFGIVAAVAGFGGNPRSSFASP